LPPSATTPPASAAAPSVSRSATSGRLVPSGNAGAFPNTRIGAEGDYLDRNNVVINVNAPSAIDEEGFTRAVVFGSESDSSAELVAGTVANYSI
jgi:hypothetical protein